MQVFYAPGIKGDSWILDDRESKHCIRVLRMKKGSPVRLIDGRGNLYEGFISVPDPAECHISISKMIPGFEKRNYSLHIAISPLKNPDRFEWFVEKSVEIGIDEITPVICRNTEKASIKYERIRGIIISAMKQSLKAKTTNLNETCTFSEFILAPHGAQKMIATCSESVNRKGLAEVCRSRTETTILIGPEGDFSDEEIISARNAGYSAVHMGESRLRSETAGVVACHSVYFINM